MKPELKPLTNLRCLRAVHHCCFVGERISRYNKKGDGEHSVLRRRALDNRGVYATVRNIVLCVTGFVVRIRDNHGPKSVVPGQTTIDKNTLRDAWLKLLR